jgi:methylmalonyl-CoA decarboxylase
MPAEPATVSAEVIDGCIGKIVFRNPSRRHALSNALLHALDARLAELAARHVPVVVLGSGIGEDVWSAGHDIGELAVDMTRSPRASRSNRYCGACARIRGS